MTETERILRAMASIGEFTVADLVLACDARAATVRTVLQRHKRNLEELPGTKETGRPGGRWKRYRMRPEAISALASDTDAESIEADGVPPGLLAAEDLLLPVQVATAKPSTLASLLRRASRFRDDAMSARGPSTPVALAHQHVVDALITLTEGEMAQDPAALAAVQWQLERSEGALSYADKGLTDAVERRLASSPLSNQSPHELMSSELSAQRLHQRKSIGHFLLGEVLELVSKFVDTTPKQAPPTFAYGQKGFGYGQKGHVVVRDREGFGYGQKGHVVVHDREDFGYGQKGYVVVDDQKGFSYGQKRLRPTGQSLAAEARERMGHRTIVGDAAIHVFDVGFGVSKQRRAGSAEGQVSPPSDIGL